jgi:hypothetical protein
MGLRSVDRASHSRRACSAQDGFASQERVTRAIAFALVALAFSVSTSSSYAQMGGFGGGHGKRSSQQQTQSLPSPRPTPPVKVPEVWPRLDPGAVFCQTQDDLARYQAKLAGAQAAQSTEPLKCRMIIKTTAIKVLERSGLAQTKVALSNDSKQVGWTNNYLPTTRPN